MVPSQAAALIVAHGPRGLTPSWKAFCPCRTLPTINSWRMKWNASAASSALDPASRPTSNPTYLIWCQPRCASRGLTVGSAGRGSASSISTTVPSTNGGPLPTNNICYSPSMTTPVVTSRAPSFPPRPLGITSNTSVARLKPSACRKPSTRTP